MAKKYTVTKEYDSLKITRKWWSTMSIFFVFFSVFWNAIVLVFLFTGAGLFILIHLLVGLGIGWYTLATIFNKTTIVASDRELDVRHGPIPWPLAKNRHINARSLVQLYVERSSVKINDQPTYNLVARLDTDANVKLITNQTDRKMLTELETAIEAHLNILNDVGLGYRENEVGTLDLEQFAEQMERLEPIMKWLPKSMVEGIKQKQAEAMQRQGGTGDATERTTRQTTPKAKPTPRRSIPAQNQNDYLSDAREMYVPDNPIQFPLYAKHSGERLRWDDVTYKVGARQQIDFADPDMPTGIQTALLREDGQAIRFIYAQEDHRRWTYYEERQLDQKEVTTLGFDGTNVANYPMLVKNGDDRYYPRNEQEGTRYSARATETIKQYIYFTVGTATQFRAVRPATGKWEVYVQEVVDAGGFSRVDS